MKLCTFIFLILATRPVLVCAGPKKKQKTDETSASVDNVNNNTDNVNSNSIALSAEYPDLTPTLEAAAAELNCQNPSSGVSYLRLVGRPPASFSSNTSATALSSQHQQQQQHVLLNQQESNQISSGEVPQQQLLLPLGLSSPDFPQGSTHRNPCLCRLCSCNISEISQQSFNNNNSLLVYHRPLIILLLSSNNLLIEQWTVG